MFGCEFYMSCGFFCFDNDEVFFGKSGEVWVEDD